MTHWTRRTVAKTAAILLRSVPHDVASSYVRLAELQAQPDPINRREYGWPSAICASSNEVA
jgi:hypothetical protein